MLASAHASTARWIQDSVAGQQLRTLQRSDSPGPSSLRARERSSSRMALSLSTQQAKARAPTPDLAPSPTGSDRSSVTTFSDSGESLTFEMLAAPPRSSESMVQDTAATDRQPVQKTHVGEVWKGRESGGLKADDAGARMSGSEKWNFDGSSRGSRPSISAVRAQPLQEQKASSTTTSYPCPFRKRNPARFNVREHGTCAKDVFGTILSLRHHILESHQKERIQHQCPRCGLGLENQASLDDHLLVPRDEMCDIVTKKPVDPEDGISVEVARRLLVGEDISTWESLWGLLFPGDNEVPNTEINPIVELVEIEQALDDGQEQLKASLHEKLRLLLPDNVDDSYCTFLSGQLELVIETHRANIIRQCLAPSAGDSLDHTPKSSNTNENKTATPAKRISTISLAKRQTRRSRRSSMMQSISLRPPSTASNTSSKPLRLSLLPSSHSTQSVIAAAERLSPAPSRDSRDSGIGMACEACGSEDCHDGACRRQEDPCSQKQTLLSRPADDNKSLPSVPSFRAWDLEPQFQQQHANLSAVSVTSSSSDFSGLNKTRSLRHKPRLRLTLKTRDISLLGPGETDDGGYSPQSFKQRVQGLGIGWSA